MRLIDADALIAILGEPHPLDFNARATICKINDMPTVDAVPVVRCKDCKKKENCKYPAAWNWCPDGEREEKTDGNG